MTPLTHRTRFALLTTVTLVAVTVPATVVPVMLTGPVKVLLPLSTLFALANTLPLDDDAPDKAMWLGVVTVALVAVRSVIPVTTPASTSTAPSSTICWPARKIRWHKSSSS
jgi:hypothetical protein